MSGNSHGSQIKHKKGMTDQKRSQLFSKLLNAITIVARQESNPQFNPRLRAAIDQAKQSNVPQSNIERAIKKASGEDQLFKELTLEAYGPGSTALIITTTTSNRNRTISEIKHLLKERGAKWANPGSVLWAFENIKGQWQAKFKQKISEEDKKKLRELIQVLEEHNDVQEVYYN